MSKTKKNLFINRLMWIIVFFSGSFFLIYLEWNAQQSHTVGWFIFASIWSAVCGIGFTLCDWIIHRLND